MSEVRFTVWQFVRLMVQMEESIKSDKIGDIKKLYHGWEDIWVDLDAKLLDLGRKNPDEFADLMMNQEVCCDDVNLTEAQIIITEFKKISQDIKEKLTKTDVDQEVEDLTFELDELIIFVKKLKSI